jgi:hypothetical protein
MLSRILLVPVVLTLLAGSAAAEEDPEPTPATSAWHMSFVGGVLVPVGDMADTHKLGLAIGGRLGWTSALGLGFEVAGTYSPLATDNLPDLTNVDTHFVTATAAPRFAFGRTFRLWLSAGGGVAYEHTTVRFRGVEVDSSNQLVPLATASVGLDLNFFDSGGLTFMATGNRTFGDDPYEFGQAIGGLQFTFR